MIDLISTDYVRCPAEWRWDSNINGWSGFHLWYVADGGANIQVDDESYDLTVGDCFLFDLNRRYICSHNPNDPLRVYTAYFQTGEFSASDVRRWLIHNASLLGNAMERAVRLFGTSDRSFGEYKAQAECWIGAVFSEFMVEEKEKDVLPAAVQKITDLMRQEPQQMLSLEDMCGVSGYSPNQIIRMFKSSYNMTPIQYQTSYKVRLAKQLLLYSDRTVAQIACDVGIPDPNYFSKVFKKYTDISPKEYRNHPIAASDTFETA